MINQQLIQASKLLKMHLQHFFNQANIPITADQWNLMELIHEHDQVSQKQLAEQSNRDPASITRTLDLLQQKGFIERKNVPENRRQYHIGLTYSGTSFINTHIDQVTSYRNQGLEGLSTKELESLDKLVRKLNKHLESLV